MSEFPYPQHEFLVLHKVVEHAAENGLIVVREANYGVMVSSGYNLCEIDSIDFIPYAEVGIFTRTIRSRPDGRYITERISELLIEHYGKDYKPVLLLKRDGTSWVGLVGDDKRRLHAVSFLNRCLEVPYGDAQSR